MKATPEMSRRLIEIAVAADAKAAKLGTNNDGVIHCLETFIEVFRQPKLQLGEYLLKRPPEDNMLFLAELGVLRKSIDLISVVMLETIAAQAAILETVPTPKPNGFRALLIVDGKVEETTLISVDGDTLGSMQAAIGGGYIESIGASSAASEPYNEVVFYCDEEGLGKRLPPNVVEDTYGTIHGPILVSGTNADGDIRSLTDAEISGSFVLEPAVHSSMLPALHIKH